MLLTLGPVEVRFTERADGDFSADASGLCVARQVHGTRVAVVDGATRDVGEADALVTRERGLRIAVRTADCAPVVLSGGTGRRSSAEAGDVVAVVHCGWRGLAGGVLEAAVGVMRGLGATSIDAALGPCIHPECYAFSKDHLDDLAARFGDTVRGTTSSGDAALDLPAMVRAALERVDVPLVLDAGACTACDAARWFSYRARRESERQATVAWLA